MFENLERRSRWRAFWPEVDDVQGAEEAIRLCYWFAFAAAGLTGAVGIVAVLFGARGFSALAGSIIVGVIGLGVRREWRSAAVAGLAFLLVGVVVVLTRRALPGMMDLLTLVAFISGVRGTFALARLKKAAASVSTPATET
jgi:hypothetical protein